MPSSPTCPSTPINGHHRQSQVIRGHPRQSMVIIGHHRSLEAIRGHQRSSGAVNTQSAHLGAIATWPLAHVNQKSSEVIQRQSAHLGAIAMRPLAHVDVQSDRMQHSCVPGFVIRATEEDVLTDAPLAEPRSLAAVADQRCEWLRGSGGVNCCGWLALVV